MTSSAPRPPLAPPQPAARPEPLCLQPPENSNFPERRTQQRPLLKLQGNGYLARTPWKGQHFALNVQLWARPSGPRCRAPSAETGSCDRHRESRGDTLHTGRPGQTPGFNPQLPFEEKTLPKHTQLLAGPPDGKDYLCGQSTSGPSYQALPGPGNTGSKSGPVRKCCPSLV